MRRQNRGDISGQTFGRNRVIRRYRKNKHRHWLYVCVDVFDRTEYLVWDRNLVPTEVQLYEYAKQRAATEGITEFIITPADIVIPTHCPVLGIELRPSRGLPTDASPTLDRIDNTLREYTPQNCWVISMRANRLKGDGTAQEHREIALTVDAVEMLGNNAAFQNFQIQRRNDDSSSTSSASFTAEKRPARISARAV